MMRFAGSIVIAVSIILCIGGTNAISTRDQLVALTTVEAGLVGLNALPRVNFTIDKQPFVWKAMIGIIKLREIQKRILPWLNDPAYADVQHLQAIYNFLSEMVDDGCHWIFSIVPNGAFYCEDWAFAHLKAKLNTFDSLQRARESFMAYQAKATCPA